MIKEKNTYKPLPESLTIKQSEINGLGLFADQPIKQATNLGMSHVQIGEEILRTPLGGFINHANEGNVVKVKMYDEVYKTFIKNGKKERQDISQAEWIKGYKEWKKQGWYK
jgi:hypothetical protein